MSEKAPKTWTGASAAATAMSSDLAGSGSVDGQADISIPSESSLADLSTPNTSFPSLLFSPSSADAASSSSSSPLRPVFAKVKQEAVDTCPDSKKRSRVEPGLEQYLRAKGKKARR